MVLKNQTRKISFDHSPTASPMHLQRKPGPPSMAAPWSLAGPGGGCGRGAFCLMGAMKIVQMGSAHVLPSPSPTGVAG